MKISQKEIPMMYTDGKKYTRDIWQFAKEKRISHHAMHDLLMYHYFPWGDTLIEGVSITYPYSADQIMRLFNALIHYDILDIDKIDKIFTKNLEQIYNDDNLYVGMSGGPDSSLIAAKLVSMGARVKGFTVVIGSVDESEDAFKVAEDLGIPIEVLAVPERDIVEELPHIIEQLGLPYDRGSMIPSYFIYKKYPGATLVLGDGAEPVFEPSYRSRLRAHMGIEDYGQKLECLTLKQFHQLVGEWALIDSPFIFRNKMLHVALFDMISETPFYYVHKLSQFLDDHKVLLPYLDIELYDTALRMKELHVVYPYRCNLYRLIDRYMNVENVKKVKMALKVNPLPSIIEEYLDEDILKLLGLNVKAVKDNWTKYILGLLSIWLKIFEKNGGIIDLA